MSVLTQTQLAQWRYNGFLSPFPLLDADELKTCRDGLATLKRRESTCRAAAYLNQWLERTAGQRRWPGPSALRLLSPAGEAQQPSQ